MSYKAKYRTLWTIVSLFFISMAIVFAGTKMMILAILCALGMLYLLVFS